MPINDSRRFIAELKAKPENFYLIHYSCQNLNDNNDGLSPRITSIAVSHYATEQSVSFSSHAVAEELGISRGEVIARFDEVEKSLLQKFFTFVRDRRGAYWIHWNMRNATYGFEHLEHRYAVLGMKDASVVPVEQRINLNDMLSDRYGSDYAPHQKLPNLMEMNGGRHRDFLSGEEEVAAFQAGEFMKMHKSTLCKVGFFHSVTRMLVTGRLTTKSKGVGARVDRLLESRSAKSASLGGTVLGLGLGAAELVPWILSLL
jgi:hypothetical protein